MKEDGYTPDLHERFPGIQRKTSSTGIKWMAHGLLVSEWDEGSGPAVHH